jgi:F0F1-type ATP synthase membrane subunit a
MMLELLVGLIQAAVFAILTLVYFTVATSQPHGAEEGAH